MTGLEACNCVTNSTSFQFGLETYSMTQQSKDFSFDGKINLYIHNTKHLGKIIGNG